MSRPFAVEQYYQRDFPRTLFPLNTTQLLVERSSSELKQHLQDALRTGGPGFPPQQRCYAAKRGYSLRRTFKLDPVAEFFVYDVVHRNRKSFRKDHRPNRRSFGYRFTAEGTDSSAQAYAAFKAAVAAARDADPLTLKADVAAYFNSIYHHDLARLVKDIGWAEPDTKSLGVVPKLTDLICASERAVEAGV